ncbi:hypothetical protein BCAR13_890039 [Paraburkholderia caribensis]|nr:hypothetical protein BCAR13_890039 [Paraburkholderia caribensis]
MKPLTPRRRMLLTPPRSCSQKRHIKPCDDLQTIRRYRRHTTEPPRREELRQEEFQQKNVSVEGNFGDFSSSYRVAASFTLRFMPVRPGATKRKNELLRNPA